MITLITGAPGSGKTLYTVDKILRDLVGTSIDVTDDDGNIQKVPRVIFSNINGLLLDHEKVDAEWLNALQVNKQTGAVVVFDEVQRVWPNRPSQSKKPPAVEYLETHRHDGIDLVIMTQNPQLLDPAVRALIGRHLHMRRVGNFGAAICYEWDHCSNALNYKSAFTKSGYRYSSSAQQLYMSAKAHTKMKRKLPFVIWFLLAGIAGSAYMWPHLMSKITGMSDKGIIRPAPEQKPSNEQAERIRQQMAAKAPQPLQALPQPVPNAYALATTPAPYQQPEIYSGCIRVHTMCRCYTTQGQPIDRTLEQCDDTTLPPPVTLALTKPAQEPEIIDVTIPARMHNDLGHLDGTVIAWMRQTR